MNTIISQGWAYQQTPQITVAVPVNLEGEYIFPSIDENKLRALREQDGEVFYEEHGIKYQMLPLNSEIDYPSVVAPEHLEHREFSPGLLFLATVNSSTHLPQIIFGEKFTYITDGQSLVAYAQSGLHGFGLHKDVIKGLAKYGSDFVVAHDTEADLIYGHNASNYFVASTDTQLDQSIHEFVVEVDAMEGLPLPDDFYQKFFNIMKVGADLMIHFSKDGINFFVEKVEMRATAHIKGKFKDLDIRIPSYLSKCLPDIACKAEIVDNHLRLRGEFITMVIGE